MYAYECPHCHEDLEHNRKLTLSTAKTNPHEEKAWPFRMFMRVVRFVES